MNESLSIAHAHLAAKRRRVVPTAMGLNAYRLLLKGCKSAAGHETRDIYWNVTCQHSIDQPGEGWSKNSAMGRHEKQ
jgi:hypothetical protein